MEPPTPQPERTLPCNLRGALHHYFRGAQWTSHIERSPVVLIKMNLTPQLERSFHTTTGEN